MNILRNVIEMCDSASVQRSLVLHKFCNYKKEHCVDSLIILATSTYPPIAGIDNKKQRETRAAVSIPSLKESRQLGLIPDIQATGK
jgi:hypothetical protein